MQNNQHICTKDGNCTRLLNGWLNCISKNRTCKTFLFLQPKLSSFDMQGSSRLPLKVCCHHVGASRAFLLHVSWAGLPLWKYLHIQSNGSPVQPGVFRFLHFSFLATVWRMLHFSSIPSTDFFTVNFFQMSHEHCQLGVYMWDKGKVPGC